MPSFVKVAVKTSVPDWTFIVPVLVGSAKVKVLVPSEKVTVPALVKPGNVDPETPGRRCYFEC